MENEKFNIKDSLKKLEEIINWFEKQKEMDIETGLRKVKEGAAIIKESRKKLKKLENEFEKVKEEIEEIDDFEGDDFREGQDLQ
ncbi:MAG TPA: hypothetical protein ENL27_00630 [Candidatus Parcubacteria bacterium]|nr:hypothetical protein [Candidatus Parcubacteria bacterium]